MSIDGLDVPEVLMEAQWKHSTDAKGDHSLRYCSALNIKTVACPSTIPRTRLVFAGMYTSLS